MKMLFDAEGKEGFYLLHIFLQHYLGSRQLQQQLTCAAA